MSGPRPVAVTGWGHVGPEGCGVESLAAAWRAGGPRTVEIDRSAGYHRPAGARRGSRVDVGALGEHLSPRAARRMSPPSRFTVVAAGMALERAGLADVDHDGTAVVTATAYGPSSYTEALLRQILEDAPTSASPFLFTEAVANAPAAQVALVLGARGPNLTFTQRQAGPLVALGRGAREVALGRAPRAIVAAVDELEPLLHAVLDRFGALAGSRGGPEVARPFDRRRRGFVVAEGATALVLESLDAARARGADVLATVRATLGACDPRAPATGWGDDGALLGDALARGLERRGLDPSDLDAVVAGACGSPGGDRAEALVLRHAWAGRALPPVVAPKAYGGEHGGALLAGALAVLDGFELAPTPGFAEADPELGVVPFGGGVAPARRLLVSAPAVGGAAAWAVLERGPG